MMARKNLTIDSLSDLMDVSKGTVRRWVEGKNVPHPAMWKHVFKALREAVRRA
jgi:DNA-binding transcriptional regulator YiaG